MDNLRENKYSWKVDWLDRRVNNYANINNTQKSPQHSPEHLFKYNYWKEANEEANIEKTIKLVEYKDLYFDNDNYRLPKRLKESAYSEIFIKDILEYMVTQTNIVYIMKTIAERGFFFGEPLLVVHKEKEGKFIVVEGNLRLGAVMLLNSPELITINKEIIEKIAQKAKEKRHIPKNLPITVHDSRNDIIHYLGYRHVTGITEWSSLAKARYVSQLYDKSLCKDEQSKILEIANISGMHPDDIKELRVALNVFETIENNRYFGITNLSEESICFSLILIALSHSEIYEYLFSSTNEELNIERLRELSGWIFDKYKEGKSRLGSYENFSKLAKIVTKEKYLEKFRDNRQIDIDCIFYEDEESKETVFNTAILDANKQMEVAYKYSKYVITKDVLLEKKYIEQLQNIQTTVNALINIYKPE
ncbi:MAG: hypothetical protein L3V56_12815 [Candidatus Magnetoovum sp. WYHC-5]|nr:hypothetical protein [Candidatus Magnetoovum sp. WYHC-5]